MWFTKLLVVLALCCSALADYKQEALVQHNDLRAIHNAPPMQLDSGMSRGAQRYAEELFRRFGGSGDLKHSGRDTRPGEGENLAVGCTTRRGGEGRTVEDAVKKWYDEVCRYNFNRHAYQKYLGHFSQLVWKSSTKLGLGKFTGRQGGWTCTYIVARYKPGGNINSPSQFRENVSKGSFRQSYCDNIAADMSVGEDEYFEAQTSSGDSRPAEEP